MKTKIILAVLMLLGSFGVAVAGDSFVAVQGVSAQQIEQLELGNVEGKGLICPGPLCGIGKTNPCDGCGLPDFVEMWQRWLGDKTNQEQFFRIERNQLLLKELDNNMDVLIGTLAARDKAAYDKQQSCLSQP